MDDQSNDSGCMWKIDSYKNMADATYVLLETLSENSLPADGKGGDYK